MSVLTDQHYNHVAFANRYPRLPLPLLGGYAWFDQSLYPRCPAHGPSSSNPSPTWSGCASPSAPAPLRVISTSRFHLGTRWGGPSTRIRLKPAMYAAAAMKVLPVPISPPTLVTWWASRERAAPRMASACAPRRLRSRLTGGHTYGAGRPGNAASLEQPVDGRDTGGAWRNSLFRKIKLS